MVISPLNIEIIKKFRDLNSGQLSKLAIIDTGINDHVEFDIENCLIKDSDVFSECNAGSLNIYNYNAHHGAKILSLICGKKIGLAKNSKYIPIRVSGKPIYKYIYAALQYLLEKQPDLINVSLVFRRPDLREFREKINSILLKYRESNIPIICAAGNNGGQCSSFLAFNENTISVGSCGEKNLIADFSARGTGVNFLLPEPKFLTISTNQKYKISTGTSYSSGFLAGIASVIITEFKLKKIKYSFEDIKSLLAGSCDNPPSLYGLSTYGVISYEKLYNNIKNI